MLTTLPHLLGWLLLLGLVALRNWLTDRGLDGDADLAVLGPAAIWTHYRTWLLVDADRAPRTVSAYRYVLWEWFGFLAPKNWNRATPKDLGRFLDRPTRSGRAKGQHLAPNTRLHYAATIRAFYAWAHAAEFIGRDPMAKVRLPKGGVPIPRAFTMGELRQILLAADHDDRLYLVCWLGYGAGCRCAEIAAVRIEDAYLDHRHPHLLVHGKGRRDRLIPLYSEVRLAITRVLAARGWPRVGPLVTSRRTPGDPLTPSGVSAILSRHIRGLGFDGSGHGLRHAFATELLEASGEERLVTISRLLGHANTTITERTYVLGYRGTPEQVLAQLPDPRQSKAVRQ